MCQEETTVHQGPVLDATPISQLYIRLINDEFTVLDMNTLDENNVLDEKRSLSTEHGL